MRLDNYRLPVDIGQVLSKDEVIRKAMVLGIHTNKGVSIKDFKITFNVDPLIYFKRYLDLLTSLNMIEKDNDFITPYRDWKDI